MTRIGFALLSPSKKPIPSTRIACLNIFPLLESFGYEPRIVFEPTQGDETPDVSGLVERVFAEGLDIVVFQKIHGNSVLKAARQLRTAGIKTIYCVCDIVNNEMAEATDATIVVTDYLKSLYAPFLHERIHVVHDGIEHPEHRRYSADASHRRTLTASLVTSHPMYLPPVLQSPPPGWLINIVGAFPPASQHIARLRSLRWTLNQEKNKSESWRTILAFLNPNIKYTQWQAESVYSELCASDIGIIPIENMHDDPTTPPSWKVKSENRLTLKMAIGLPVIATPIPAYENVIEHGVNGYFATSADDWKHFFNKLRAPDLRLEMGRRARASVLSRFSKAFQAQRFISVLRVLDRPDAKINRDELLN